MIESDAFHPGRSGRNHLKILADATGIAHSRVDALLEQLGLTDAADRKAGGAVTATVFIFMVAPPLVVQLANGTASWMPANLANVISGTVDDIGQLAALAALVVWAAVPAIIGLISVQRRDVV